MESNANTEPMLPKAGWDTVAAAAEENGKMELDEVFADDPNKGALQVAADEADAPN